MSFEIHHSDCLDALKAMPDNSVDSIVTDPPYGLSSQRPVESLPNRLGRAFLDVVLPDLYHANVATGRLDKFPGPLGSVTFLDWMGRAIREKARVCVPVSALNLKRNTLADQEIEDATERAVFGADGVLPNVVDPKSVEFFGNYILNLRRPPDPSRGDGSGRLFRELGLGRVGVLVVSSFDSELSRFLRTLDPCRPSFFADFVGACDDTKGRADGAPEVVTITGAEVRAVLALDVRNGALELIPASPALEGDAVFDLASAQPIGAGARTGCLAPKFKPIDFRFVGDSTNRALTIYLHEAVLSALDYSRNGFMGKSWDGDVPSVDIWAECLRVLKPGGHLLAFAGTRTQHRMAVRIEDAGFEIRDMIAWVYGSGFPKSLDVSKAIDKAAGVEREVVGSKLGRPGMAKDGRNQSFDSSVNTYGGGGILSTDITAPATDAARQWQGWGTALKPSLEPLTVARKPLIGTVAANVLAHGTGALNIDGCRVGEPFVSSGGAAGFSAAKGWNENSMGEHEPKEVPGRWPANLIHDGSEPADLLGEAARFFYCAKASKKDRDEGNVHPTVKPTDLMRYLCRLVTPPGGVVLDPFMGSGSTGKAAMLEGFRFIGIEREAEYVEIARARILSAMQNQPTPQFDLFAEAA